MSEIETVKYRKYSFEYLLNDKQQYIEDTKKHINEIYEFLINLDIFPLFNNEINKIKNQLNFSNLELEHQKKVVKELFKLYHCNSVNANLSEFGLGNRIGRLSGNNITSGIIISKSITGIRESKYEF